MSDDLLNEAPASPPRPASVAPAPAGRQRGCAATLAGSLLTIALGAVLGAALTLAVLWFGPANGFTLPDSTGRLAALEQAQQTAVIERTDMGATLRGLSDVRGSLDTLRDQVQTLETAVGTRETNVDDLQKQISANLDSLLVIQGRLDALESIPANAALAERLATAELDLATIGATLDRLRQALGGALALPAPTEQPVSGPTARPDLTPTPTP